jgi:16S rRNA (uracil1498-N3)-methyltransferase
MQDAKVRLYVEQALGPGQAVALSQDQAHYLFAVMRMGVGAAVALFNGRDGEWLGRVAESGKRGGVLVCETELRPLHLPPDLWLLFAPIKKARTDFIVEKAVELGVSRVMPVQTAHTNSERIRQDRLQAHAVEAAEQCGATCVPEVAALEPLDRVLRNWSSNRRLLWCDEHRAGQTGILHGTRESPWAVLVGPEGGFSEGERTRLSAMPQVVPFALGPRILRADTAVVAALALWQAALGDWA